MILYFLLCVFQVSAQGFELDNLYLHFFVDLPKSKYIASNKADSDLWIVVVLEACIHCQQKNMNMR